MKTNILFFKKFPFNKLSLNKVGIKALLKRHTAKGKLAMLALVIANLSACSSLGVEPWERDLLAKKEMALTSNPVDAALDDHRV